MMAMLFVTRIIAGKSTYEQVPTLLREQVAELLRDVGLGELVTA